MNVFFIELPSLRQRAEDVPLLIEAKLQQLATNGREAPQLSSTVVEALMAYDWPGNVRELGNLAERLSILYAGKTVEVEQLPVQYRPLEPVTATMTEAEAVAMPSFDGSLDLKQYLHEMEKQIIQRALLQSEGVVSQAARLLRMNRTTLIEKMRKLRIRGEDD